MDYSFCLKRERAEMAGTGGVCLAGYSNDSNESNGYIPRLRFLKEGGYEADTGWADSVEERIAAKVHALHRRISE